MNRPNTPDTIREEPGPEGNVRRIRTIRVKRICDACDEPIGDATEAEIEAALAGLPLPSVAAEHGCQLEATA